MCEICKTQDVRHGAHIRSSRHLRALIKIFKEKKRNSIQKYGYFKYEPD